ncbi:hypothetical protein HZB03_01210 [Candidatus Woesearchaeota archaeon]|nr:hypothetical protein [Candidatus Woesearchaeota archaeon]
MNDSTRDLLRWFFRVDFSDWTNYAAMILTGFLLYWGVRTIISTVA